MANNNNGEPSSAPQPERWYELKLGSSFKDHSPSKFCTLRYEFKPASIDKSQPGSLHKNKENRVTVEFHNNQPGKPKVSFEGSSEDYKDNDAVLFFDGETFQLERLHRAVKRLRHVRLPGESAAAAAANMASASSAVATNTASAASAATNMESRSPQLGKISKTQSVTKPIVPVHVEVERIDIGKPESPGIHQKAQVEVEHIDIGEPESPGIHQNAQVEVEHIDIGEPESPGMKPTNGSMDINSAPHRTFPLSPEAKIDEQEENINIDIDDEEEAPSKIATGGRAAAHYVGFDINIPTHNDTDDEIGDIDVGDDEAGMGMNAAEASRAQVNSEGQQQQHEEEEEDSSSSSDSSGSGSSGSGSGSGSSSSDSSDDDSASSGGEIDV